MVLPRLRWFILPDRKAMIALQSFTCTTARPRSPRGRKLSHPRPWELEAQSLLRRSSQSAGPNDRVLAALPEEESPEGEIRAAAWIEHHAIDSTPALFIKSCGIDLEFRRQHGLVANELMTQILSEARREYDGHSRQQVIVHGNVHVQNVPSERLFVRFGFEPIGLPDGDYQKWSLIQDFGQYEGP